MPRDERPGTEVGRLRVSDVMDEGGELVGENTPWLRRTVSGGVA